MDRLQFFDAVSKLGIELSEAQLDHFETFEENLYLVNEERNLTRVPREECWSRHFLDSLLIAPMIPESAKVLDIGCGPGFPSWPLACARPDLQVTGMDSNSKMLGFLSSQSLPNLNTSSDRAEESELREKFDFVTGRAVAPMPIQCEISAAFLRIGGFFIPMRTQNDQWDADALKLIGLEFLNVETRPIGDAQRVFPIFRKFKSTPRKFPRRWSEIKKNPLF
jgi:16S rRNA (guanine527-N7)-methyltransferase